MYYIHSFIVKKCRHLTDENGDTGPIAADIGPMLCRIISFGNSQFGIYAWRKIVELILLDSVD